VDSGGAALLKTAGMGAEEIAIVAKGAGLITKSVKAGLTAEDALATMDLAGVDRGVVTKGLDLLDKAGMSRGDMIRGGLIHSAGSAALRSIGTSVPIAEKVAKSAQILIDGGFAAQNIYGAAMTTPAVFDALKEGNLAKAAELATIAAGTAGFGLMGTRAALKEAGGMMDDARANMGLNLKPSDENILLSRKFRESDRQILTTNRTHDLWNEEIRAIPEFKELAKKGEMGTVAGLIRSLEDEKTMRRNKFLVEVSAGRREAVPQLSQELAPEKPLLGLSTDEDKRYQDLKIKQMSEGLPTPERQDLSDLRKRRDTTNIGWTWVGPEAAVEKFRKLADQSGGQVPITIDRSGSFHDPGASFRYDPNGTLMNEREFKAAFEKEQREDSKLFDMSRKASTVLAKETPSEGGVETPKLQRAPIQVTNAEKLGDLQDDIMSPKSGVREAGLYKNSRGEHTLMLTGEPLKAFNREFENQLSEDKAYGVSSKPDQTLAITKLLLRSKDPEAVKLGELLTPVRNEQLSLVNLGGDHPLVTMLHEHAHILAPEDVRLVNDRIKTLPGYQEVVARLRRQGYNTEEGIQNEVVPWLMSGQMLNQGIDNKAVLNLAWEALNTVGEQVSQKKYELLLGNMEAGARDELYGHLQRTGLDISREATPRETGANAPQAGAGEGVAERGPGGIRAGDAQEGPSRLAQEIADRSGPDRGESATETGLLTDVEPRTSNARLQEIAAEGHIKKNHTDKEIDALVRSYDYDRVTQAHKNLAAKLREYSDATLLRAYKAEVLHEGVPHYLTSMWQPQDLDNPAANRVLAEARSGRYANNTSMARHRVFDHAIEGQLLGRKLTDAAANDPIALIAHNAATFDKVIASRNLLKALLDNNFRAFDGRPMLVIPGNGEIKQDGQGNNEAILTHPDRVRSIRVADKIIEGYKKNGQLEKMLKEGKLIKYGAAEPLERGSEPRDVETHYAFGFSDYKSLDHPLMNKWGFATQDTKGVPILMDTSLKVHPDAYDYIKRQLDTQSPVAKVLKPVFTAGREAKGALLSFNVFHLTQEALRAIMTGISPFGVEKWDLATNKLLGDLVEHGLLLKDYSDGMGTWQEGQMVGHSHLISKIPVLGPMQDWLQNFLFKKYIPGLKARAAQHLYERYKNVYAKENLSERELLTKAAKDTNERFGGLNLRAEGRALATQDIFRLIALAPDWLESELRSLNRAMGGDGKVLRRDLAKMTVGMWAVARLLNQLNTGNPHYEAPFGVAYNDDKGKEKVISMRTLPTDMLHAVNDPLQFMRYRASPLARTASTIYTGRDSMGRRIPTHDLIYDVLGDAVTPLPVQNVVKKMGGFSTNLNTPEMIGRGLGAQITQYKTKAQAKAGELSMDRTDTGPVDISKMRQHTMNLEAEDRLRAGTMSREDLNTSVDQGLIHPKEARKILDHLKETNGMEPDMGRLYARSSRLPMEDFLLVWNEATDAEKTAMIPLMQKKKKAYFKKAMSEMTHQQRRDDVTYLKLRQMFPSDSPF